MLVDDEPEATANEEAEIGTGRRGAAGKSARCRIRGPDGKGIGRDILRRGEDTHDEQHGGKSPHMGLRRQHRRRKEAQDDAELAGKDPDAFAEEAVDQRRPQELQRPGQKQHCQIADLVERHAGIPQHHGQRSLHHRSGYRLGGIETGQEA